LREAKKVKKIISSLILSSILVLLGSFSVSAKDSVTIGMRLEPAPGLDPTAGAAAAISQVTWYNIYEGLTRISEKGVVSPMLSSGWKVSNDGLTYTFTLLEGV
jgi:peptide/nickel transport system substrate-binding protein